MPPRDWRLRIAGILAAIQAIADYTQGMDYAAFTPDPKTMDAVLRNIMVIGEAASRIPEEVTQAHPEIPWRDMQDMRNHLVHEYFGVSAKILWDTVRDKLPPLVEHLRPLLHHAP
ncbi:MAG: DUF86 domain-containing protein [Acidobacteriota bacterium]